MSYRPESKAEKHLLRRACRLWYLQTGFTNVNNELVEASAKTLLRLLESVSGRKIEGKEDLEELVRQARRERLERKIEPVHVVWRDGQKSVAGHGLRAFLPEEALGTKLSIEIRTESGDVHRFETQATNAIRRIEFEGKRYVAVRVPINLELSTGYHQLTLSMGGATAKDEAKCRLMCAQRKVGANVPDAGVRKWGLFAPLYGLRSEHDWGIGDLGEMERVQELIHEQGGEFFGTLPMLSTNCEAEDCDPSPYSPVSRLFWNEIFLDVPRLIEEMGSARAKQKWTEASFQEELKRLRKADLVDHAGVFRLKKQVLGILAEEFFRSGKNELESFKDFLKRSPEAEDYAEFRSGGDAAEKKYHLYVQYEMDLCLAKRHARARKGEIAGLYLDFPVGVSRGGFDSREYASSFVKDSSAGAPPDAFFAGGQDWGFAPLHPVHLREEGYEYFIKCMRHHMRYASVLRLDHIMAFHRIYAIPTGAKAKDGTYIRYCAEEFYALLSIEAERCGVRIIGEDLGTVPQSVRSSLEEHDCLGMWVLPFEAGKKPLASIEKIPKRSLACLNTHDMVPFAGHLVGRDVELFLKLGVIDAKREVEMAEDREETGESWMKNLKIQTKQASKTSESSEGPWKPALQEILPRLAKSRAEMLLINVEDLWGETEPQNIPGTWKEYPNWRRKLRVPIGDWIKEPWVEKLMQQVSECRRAPAKVGESGKGNDDERANGTEPVASR